MGRRADPVLFWTVALALSPVGLVGYLAWVASLVAHRGTGVSATAQGPLSARWFAHHLGTRPDEPAHRLLRALPGVPTWAPGLVAAPVLLASRLTGHVPRVLRYPFSGEVPPVFEVLARTTFFDSVVERSLPEIDQLVILGAGFDTRAFRLPLATAVRSFEVDTPATQRLKRALADRVGLDTSRVVYVAADFERESWFDRLVDAGLDAGRPALFLCEGVVMYLEPRAAEELLRTIAGTAPGTVLAFDHLTTEPLTSTEPYWRYARAGTRLGGEPVKFGVPSTPPARQRLEELLSACGLTLSEHQTLGAGTAGHRAWGGFAVATVPSDQPQEPRPAP